MLVCRAFAIRRKTLENRLSGIPRHTFDFKRHAEELSVSDFIALASHFRLMPFPIFKS